MSNMKWKGGVYTVKDAGHLGGPEAQHELQETRKGLFRDQEPRSKVTLPSTIEDIVRSKSGRRTMNNWAEEVWPELGDVQCTVLEGDRELWVLNENVRMQVYEKGPSQWLWKLEGLKKGAVVSEPFELRRSARASGFVSWAVSEEFHPTVIRRPAFGYAAGVGGCALAVVALVGLSSADIAMEGANLVGDSALSAQLFAILLLLSSMIAFVGFDFGNQARKDLSRFRKYREMTGPRQSTPQQ